MTRQELRSALRSLAHDQVRLEDSESGSLGVQISVPLSSSVTTVEIAGARIAEGTGPQRAIVAGRAAFPELRLGPETEIEATFDIFENGSKALRITMRFQLPERWEFRRSFPDMP